MKRQIVLDTETTGLKPEDGHRILEVGAVELIDNVKTGKVFHKYINPERESDPEALKVHGLTTEFLSDKPKFNEIVSEFLEFVGDSELVIHNAKFDLKFIDSELDRSNKGTIWTYIKNAVCTLELDRRLFAKSKHTLDAMCDRYEINREGRVLHGALMDADLLAECFIKTNQLYSSEDIESDLEQKNWIRPEIKRYNIVLPSVKLSEKEEAEHLSFLKNLEEKDKVTPVFNKTVSLKP